jgi:hypothetical protein
MGFAIDQFVECRPYLFHLTARSNALEIVRRRQIESASQLLRRAGRGVLLRQKREDHVAIEIDGHRVQLRDQAPLHAGNIEYAGQWRLPDVIETLNDRIFFWPGTASGPIVYGRRHFERYRIEDVVVIVLAAHDAFRINADAMPSFCRYNSGSPRCSGGRKSPRGPDTFLSAAEFVGSASQVVEVTFLHRFALDPKFVRVSKLSEWITD